MADEDLLLDDPELEDSDEDSDEEGSDDEQTVDPIEQLRAEIAERDQRLNAALEKLSATAGRLQSMASKPREGGMSETEKSEFAQATQLLDMVLDNLDETVLPADKLKEIQRTREVARRAAEKNALKDEVKREVLQEVAPEDDDEAVYLSQVRAFEDDIVEEIESYDLDPTDFDWKEATKLLVDKGQPATRRWFREKIKAAIAERDSTDRRSTKKVAASKSPKAAGGVSDDPASIISDPTASLDKRIAALRKMGALK